MADFTPSVSIFIPTYNDERDLSSCLESICHLDYPKNKLEIVIWDNASQDDTIDMVQERYREMTKEGWLNLSLIEHHSNEGSYIPYNLVLPLLSSRTKYILGLDADVEIAPEAPTRMVAAAQQDKVAVVGARSVYFDKPGLTSHGAGFVNSRTARYSEKDSTGQIECDYVIGCCWLLNRVVLGELGCFDPEYYINHWEVDYCLRAKQRGFRIIYEPQATAKHKIPLAGTPGLDRIYYLYRNKIMLIRKNPEFFKLHLAFPLCFSLSLGRILFSFSWQGKVLEMKSALLGLFDGLSNKRGEKSNRGENSFSRR
jgi:GT2 family glycosyltransferase